MGKTKKHASMAQNRRNQERLNNAELVLKDDMQTYGMVLRALGDRRFQCKCSDGKERTCKIRGKFRGRLYIRLHDILLIALREDEPDKADIIQKYRPEEVHELKRIGEFTDRDFAIEGDESVIAALPADDADVVWTNEEIDEI
jgi:translation initiation factor 1A